MSTCPALAEGQLAPAHDLPEVALCRVFSYILRSNECLRTLSAVSTLFKKSACGPLSWEGAAVCLNTDDLHADQRSGRNGFELLTTQTSLCEQAFVNFDGAHSKEKRFAAERCFFWLASECNRITSMCIRNWCMFERCGLTHMSGQFPALRHLELSGCDHISTYEAVVPILKEHPTLLSLRATFHPRATLGQSFVEHAPPSLIALGFVNIDSAAVLTSLLAKCSIQHLWFAVTHAAETATIGGNVSAELFEALVAGGRGLKTLAVPPAVSERRCAKVAAACPQLELLCRMRIGSPAFGSQEMATDFELLPSGQGVVLRRRGSSADLAANGSLWAPHAQCDVDIKLRPALRKEYIKTAPSPSAPSWRFQARPSSADLQSALAAAVRERRQLGFAR